MNIVFVDWTPTYRKSDIHSGIVIRRYYAWTTLNEMFDNVVSFRNDDGSINWEAVIKMFKGDAKIWVEYGCGGVAHSFVILASFTRFKKTIILNVHDFIRQQMDIGAPYPFLKRLRLHIVEQLILKRANTIILPAPGLLDWFTPKKSQSVLMMVPGVGEDELSIHSSKNNAKNKKIKTAIYFGSMRSRGIIPQIAELFSKLDGWELLLLGPKEGAKIEETENVKYIGVVSHDKLQSILNGVDVILIALPKREYFDKATPNKLAHALKSCKPVIATKLKGISSYVSMVGLEENVIYVEEWNLDNLKDALRKAQNLNINAEGTIEKLRPMAWEPRFRKAIEIIIESDPKHHNKVTNV